VELANKVHHWKKEITIFQGDIMTSHRAVGTFADTLGFSQPHMFRFYPDSNTFAGHSKGFKPDYNLMYLNKEQTKIALQVLVPGFKKNDIEVSQEEDTLTVKVSRNAKHDTFDEMASYMYRGFTSRGFVKEWTIAADVVVDFVMLEDGILTILMDKIVPQPKNTKTFTIK
jgi:HSP20 family molecular chaperone IbpA